MADHRIPITLRSALGPMARPLAEVLANWRVVKGWRRALVRRVWPDLARALDDLSEALGQMIGPL